MTPTPIVVDTGAGSLTPANVSGNYGATGVEIFNHRQYCFLTYTSGTQDSMTGDWPPNAASATATFEMQLTVVITERISPFPLYGSGTHGFLATSALVSSVNSAAGLGSQGVVYQNEAGVKWRPATSTDQNNDIVLDAGRFGPIVITSPVHLGGDINMELWKDNTPTMMNFLQEVVSKIPTGGYEYSYDNTMGGTTTTTPVYEWDPLLVL